MRYVFIIILLLPLLMKAQDINEGLVGYWPFNGNANDESILEIHGINSNAMLSADRFNEENKAYYFNGENASINCSSNDRGIVNSLSISAWVKTTSLETMTIVHKYDNFDMDAGFHLKLENGYLAMGGRVNNNVYYEVEDYDLIINDGQWHFVVGIMDQENWRLYVDCELRKEFEIPVLNYDLTNEVNLSIGENTIGGGPNIDHRWFEGSIDEVRIYNRVLLEEEMDILCSIKTTNVKGLENSSELIFYPNPSTGLIYFREQEYIYKIEVYNSHGKLILIEKNIETVLDLSFARRDIYFLLIRDRNNDIVHSKKILLN